MADINSAFEISRGLAFDSTQTGIFTGGNNPTIVPGEVAPIGSLFLRTDGKMYSKWGPQDIDWSLISDSLIVAATGLQTGFIDNVQTTLSFDDLTRTLSITPTGSFFDIYYRGTKYTRTVVDTVTIPDVEGTWIFYYTNGGAIVLEAEQSTQFDFRNVVPAARIYWDATNKEALWLLDQRALIAMDWSTRLYARLVNRTVVENGLLAINFTTTGNGSNDADAQLGITNGRVLTGDIDCQIVHSITPLPNLCEQFLTPIARIPMYYRDGINGDWRKIDATDFPAAFGPNRLQYNEYTGTAWQLTESPNNGRYIGYWLFATNSVNEPIIGVVGQALSNSLSEAKEANSFGNVAFGLDFPVRDSSPIYRLIFDTSNAFANVPHAKMVEIEDARGISAITPTSGSIYQPYDGDLATISTFLTTGILARTGTNTWELRSVEGTVGEVDVVNGDGVLGNPTIGLAADTVLPGSGGAVLPSGTTGERPVAPENGTIRYNSSLGYSEVYDGSWARVGNTDGNVLVSQTAHGFAGLTVVRRSGGLWVKAQANDINTTGVAVVTSVVDVNTFTLSQAGRHTLAAHGLTIGTVYYLSNTIAGVLTSVEPSVSQPILYVEDANNIWLLPYRPGRPFSNVEHSYVWRDLISPLSTAKTTGSTSPTWLSAGGGFYAYAFDKSQTNELQVFFHIDHDYAPGTTIFPHIHWMPSDNTTGVVRWRFSMHFAKGHSQQAFSMGAPIVKTIEQAASGQAWRHQIAELSVPELSSSIEPDAILVVAISRDGAHANDTYDANAFGLQLDLHYQADRVGTPNKAPNFYS